ncbi:hypothetical protein L226DRAFT_525530 [Lentinus tigrinus ALCF2SS1-7]|uniref:uncharacterized protein n=1 Tax=Lentinus tigrinus ALCF2SS1-7 TaxID=1328758 RepID=UPI001165FA9B|nr:hypothetical protein L226DRAFT_525530 [Lentinus tigrinus ALCF2SS1-7]
MSLLSALSLREWDGTMGYIKLKPTINFLKLPVLVLTSGIPATCPRCAVFGNRPPSVQDAPLRVPGTCRWTGFEDRGPSQGVVLADMDYTNTDVKNSEAIFKTLNLSAHKATAVGGVTGRAILC